MAGKIKKLLRSEGVTVAAPTDLSFETVAGSFANYASDALYVAGKGAAAADGDSYYNTTTDTVRVFAAGSWVNLGAGGASGINYVVPSSFVVYNDGVVEDPIDGIDGSGSVSVDVANTSDPLVGSADVMIMKSAVSCKGQGISCDFAIDRIFKDAPQVLRVKFYFIGSASFSADDISVWLYDRDAAALIQPVPYRLDMTAGVFEGYFQTNYGNNDYRLIVHIRSTNATFWTLQLDEISVGPADKAYGAIITDWQAFTAAFTNLPTSTASGFWRRVGGSMEVNVTATASGAATGTISMTVPNSASIDSARHGAANDTGPVFGSVNSRITAYYDGSVMRSSATAVSFVGYNTVANNNWNATIPGTWANGSTIAAHFMIPIVGWNSGTIMSSESGIGVTAVTANRYSANQTVNGGTTAEVVFNNLANSHIDTKNCFSTTTGRFTARESGYYDIGYGVRYTAATFSGAVQFFIQKNGTGPDFGFAYNEDHVNGLDYTAYGRTIVYLIAGEYVSLWCTAGGATPANDLSLIGSGPGDQDLMYFTVTKCGGSPQIAASEVVAASAILTTDSVAVGASATTIPFNSKVFDSHGTFDITTNVGRYTAPISGYYRISAVASTADATWLAGEYFMITLYIDGAVNSVLGFVDIGINETSDSQKNVNGSVTKYLTAGQYIEIRGIETSAATIYYAGSNNYTHVSIERIGGVM